ncbi:putative Inositol-1-monophosphatase [Desulfamplus magnetovallimortis]|uniref:Inositol-1-monophosphatase n=1 Tax=Desulfamplus magnetovallimortis TaxID=1246637 RepID=A0A1W1HEG5_9BACT|nr:inositol monophosphatase family protein [Desulfamplus magnetovallimortis]SLM30894.1 putative Inositol-1-monophosphatase [Desulfamplus magnetovallimortis]
MITNSFKKELLTAQSAALAAGKIQTALFHKSNQVIRKSPKEFVTTVDMNAQKEIELILNHDFPAYSLFTEEKVVQGKYPENERFWIVDPLDGTHNYIARLPFYGVSIALMEKKQFLVGVIYLPAFDKLFHAVKGEGAYCNEKKISVSKNGDLSKSMVAYDNQFYLDQKIFDNYKKLIQNTFTTRILGSAVCDICLIASGDIDARIWNKTKLVDIAAGVTILQEAGGSITDFKGNPVSLFPSDVIASNGKVDRQLMNLF